MGGLSSSVLLIATCRRWPSSARGIGSRRGYCMTVGRRQNLAGPMVEGALFHRAGCRRLVSVT